MSLFYGEKYRELFVLEMRKGWHFLCNTRDEGQCYHGHASKPGNLKIIRIEVASAVAIRDKNNLKQRLMDYG